MKQSDCYTWILYLEKLPIWVQDRIKTFSDMWDFNYFSSTFSRKNTWGFVLSKKEENQEREYQRIGRGIKQKELQNHGKEKSQITVMQGWERRTLRMGKLQERFFYKMKLRWGMKLIE